jgi:hypothetical protein
MNDAVNIIRSFYKKLADGDATGALALMASDIEWITMWHYKVRGRGPESVAEGMDELRTGTHRVHLRWRHCSVTRQFQGDTRCDGEARRGRLRTCLES